MPSEKPRIFLCYARKDQERVEELYNKLSYAGFNPWMDTKDILPGEDWKRILIKAIRESPFFLACLTNNSVNKRGVIQEEIKEALEVWRQKLESDIYLIPVRLEDCKVPESLTKFQWVDLFKNKGFERLKKSIKAGRERLGIIQPLQLPSHDNANYTGQQWKEEMNRLGLSTPDEVEETPYQFILQYDIKDSLGKEDPENKNKSPIVKRYINRELQKTKENVGDGLFNIKEEDSKNIYIEKSVSVKRYLSTIMNTTAEYQMFLRIGVISIQDTGKPICIRRKDKEIDISPNTIIHTLVNRVAMYRKERERHHRLTISEDVMYKVWGNENNFILDKDWRMERVYADEKSKRHIVPFPEVNKYLPIYIVKCYSENEIGNKKFNAL